MKHHILIPALALFLTASAALAADAPSTPNSPGVIAKPQFSKPAPALAITDLQGKPLSLADFKGKPVVLEFASLTEPAVRLHAKDVEKLAAQFKGKVTFLLIYQKEAHPAGTADALALNDTDGYSAAEATTPDERIQRARQLIDKLSLANETVATDAPTNDTAKRYGNLPNMTFLLDEKGNLAAAYPWMDPVKLRGAITDVLASKPVAAVNMGPVRSDQQPISIPDGNGNAGPGGGVVSAAIALDGMILTDAQRVVVTKSFATYVASLRNLKEKADKAAAAGALGGGAAGVKPGAPGAAPAATAPGAKSPEDRADELKKVGEAAKELKAALKSQLNAADYQKMIDALNQGPGKVFFAGPN